MRPLMLVLLLLPLGLPSPAPAQAGGDTVRIRGLAIPVPGEVAGFSLVDRKVYEDEVNGTSLRYRTPDGRIADVYLYPVPPLEGCTTGCDSVAVHDETGSFAGMIPRLLERGYYESLAVETDRALQVEGAAGPLRGRYLRLRGTQKGSEILSHFYLLGAGSFLLKTRATHPGGAEGDAAVDRFVRAFAREVRAHSGTAAEPQP